MKVANPMQMNIIDSISIERYGIPGIVLMENAALKVAGEACRMLGEVWNKKILVIAGKGNNGGDAFAVARHLFLRKASVRVYLLCNPEEVRDDALVNYRIINRLGIPVEVVDNPSGLREMNKELKDCSLIIDGLYGTGFRGEINGIAAEVVQMVNNSGVKVLSIDIPSGVDGTTGKVSLSCVRADSTVTFGLPKFGLLVHPGCDYTGKLLIADIGLPEAAMEEAGISIWLNDSSEIRKLIPERKKDSNKGSYGRALLVAGSKGMTGAACLAAGACLRSGAGLVYLAGPASLVPVFGAQITEAVVLPLEDEGKGFLSAKCFENLKEKIENVDALAIGPGLSVCEDIRYILEQIIKSVKIPVVFDADALNAISKDTGILKNLKAPAVVTPHPGEMARLLGTSVAEVQDDRKKAALEFAMRWNVTVVLKGSRTIIAAPDGRVFVNATGNPGLATAGTGDVLTGIIAGFLAQGLDTVNAARAGVYIHGLAGDLAAKDRGEHGIIAGDVVEAVPYAIKNLLAGTVIDSFERI